LIDELGIGIGVLEKEAFRSWLQTHADVWVGVPCMTDGCPLAVYLYEVTGRRWHVSILGYTTEDRREAYPLPRWAKEFVKAIDTHVTQCPAFFTGQLALERLWWVERVYGGLLEEYPS
jgi:hypothetical protein